MTERSVPGNSADRHGHLRIVTSSEASETHETETSLVFFDLLDTSMTKDTIDGLVTRMLDHELTMAELHTIPPESYPRMIAHTILSHLHIQPDIDELRELANEGKPDPEERQQLKRALEIERLFKSSLDALEEAAEKKRTHDLVNELETHMDTHDRYDTNLLRTCLELKSRRGAARIEAPVIVASRILKTMIWLHDNEADPS